MILFGENQAIFRVFYLKNSCFNPINNHTRLYSCFIEKTNSIYGIKKSREMTISNPLTALLTAIISLYLQKLTNQ